MFYYTAFGFTIASDIHFPELLEIKKRKSPDVRILVGITPRSLDKGATSNPELWITPDEYLIHFKDVAFFYANHGNQIIVETYKNSECKNVRLLLLCNAMAAIIHQKKLIPFHASGIIIQEGIALITGHSGSGKSTAIKALNKQGHKIFTDDVCVLKIKNEKVFAIPSYPMMKLWENSFDLLQLENKNEEQKLRSDINKYGVFFHDEFVSKWRQVKKIFKIEKSETTDHVSITKLKGIEAFKAVGENSYRGYYIEPMKLNSLHFNIVNELLKQCDIYHVIRPSGKNSISEVIKIIEQQL